MSTDETAFITSKGIRHLIDQSESHFRRREKRKRRPDKSFRDEDGSRGRDKHDKDGKH